MNIGSLFHRPASAARLLLCALAAAACLAPAAPALGVAKESSPAAATATTASPRALVRTGRFAEALAVLRPRARAQTVEAGVLFLYGLAASGASQRPGLDGGQRDALLDEAIAAFRTMLNDRPELVRVRLELARAFFMKREDGLARQHFEQALAGKLPPPVVVNIEHFLSIMRARRLWRAHFGTAVAPTSNLNGASSNRVIWLDTILGRLPFTLGDETAPKSGIGLSLWGGGEYHVPLDPRWRLRAGSDASRMEYKGGKYDRTRVSAHLGPRWLAGPSTELSLLATAERQWTAGTPETDRHGLRLETAHRASSRVRLRGAASWQESDCRDCDWLDGPIRGLSVDASWAATPTLRVDAGAGWERTRTKARHRRNTAIGAHIGASLDLPRGFTMGARARERRTGYDGSGAAHHTDNRKSRVDRTHTLSASVFNRKLTLFGFSPRVSVHREMRTTNAQTLSYKRLSGEIGAVRQF